MKEDGRGMQYAWEVWEMRTKFWSENLNVRDHFEYVDIDDRMLLKWILEK
jgi:hypothetical protein